MSDPRDTPRQRSVTWQDPSITATAFHDLTGLEFLRRIQKPTAGAIVYRTRAGSVATATATVDTSTGIATITGHVAGDTYTWAGEFDVPVTFTDDAWVQQLEAMNIDGAVSTMPAINVEEIVL